MIFVPKGVRGFVSVSNESKFQIKKFADKLKDIVCILLGCTREQLEEREFKEKELGEEWRIWSAKIKAPFISSNLCPIDEIFTTKQDVINFNKIEFGLSEKKKEIEYYSYILTPRLLLQLLGTECGKQILHPNIWVNALFSQYRNIRPKRLEERPPFNEAYTKKCLGCKEEFTGWKREPFCENCSNIKEYPNWIITDTRFPNEAKAVKDREGIVIRVNRYILKTSEEWQTQFPKIIVLDPDGWDRKNYDYSWKQEKITLEEYKKRLIFSTCQGNIAEISNCFQEHPSETALDNWEFDYVIDNNKDIEHLIHQVKKILLELNIL